MAKLTLDMVTGGYDLSVINNNFDKIETAIENTLSRDGTAPNTLEDDLDVNNKTLYNVASLATNSLTLAGQTVTLSTLNVAGIDEILNYAALRAYAGSEVTFLVKGHTAALDGGGGVFRYDPTDTTSADNGGTILVDAAGRRWKREFSGAASLRWFGAKLDGVTDDTTAWSAFAAQTTTKNLFVPDGTTVVGAKVTFAQDYLTVTFARNAKILQKANTQTLDTLIEFSGDYGSLVNCHVDGNVANNAGYTGRNELVKISGDYWNVSGFIGRGTTSSVAFAAALYITGRYNKVTNITTHDTGTNAIRDQGDYNEFRGMRMFEWGQHGFVKDSGYLGAASNYTLVQDVIAISTKAESNMEAILFDHDGVQGKLCRVKNVHIETPNSTSTPDAIKFAYMKRIEIDGLRVINAASASFLVSLRFQQQVESIDLNDVVLAGGINFDPDISCFATLRGRSIIGNDYDVNATIEDFRGTLVIADGVELRRIKSYAITTASGVFDNKVVIGRCVFHGAVGFTPVIINQIALATAGTTRRAVAGGVTIGKPISIEGTMKSLEVDGRWIGLSETQDAAVAQAGDRVFLVGNSDFPPRDTEGWKRADIIRKRVPAASSVIEKICVTAGASTVIAWAATTAYSVGNWVFNGANVYACTTAGTSAGSGGPTGTGTGIADGTVVWDFVDVRAVFKDTVSAAA